MNTKLYKILGDKGQPCNGGSAKWHLPRGNRPGKWMPAITRIVPCSRGYHLVAAKDIAPWISGSAMYLFEAESRGEIIDCANKVVSGEARLVALVGDLSKKVLRLSACAFADHVLPIWEKQYPKDDRPRNAISVARRFVLGKATAGELAAARTAAWAAAEGAAWAAEHKWQGQTILRIIRKYK